MNSSFVYCGSETPSNKKFVIELGSYQCRIGNTGENTPILDSYLQDEDSQLQNAPIENGIITNWDYIQTYLEAKFKNYLDASMDESTILLTQPVWASKEQKEKLTQIFFETFNVQGFQIEYEASLLLNASGRNGGLALLMGHGISSATCRVDGRLQKHSMLVQKIAGNQIDEWLSKLLLNNNQQIIAVPISKKKTKFIKENICYVAKNYNLEKEKFAASVQYNANHKFPDGQELNLSHEMFTAPELLFDPKLNDLQGQGVHQMIYNTIYSHPLQIRIHLFENIVVGGGCSLFPCFPERLCEEVIKICSSTLKIVMVFAHPKRRNFVWLGGSIVSQLETFSITVITQSEYNEYGPNIINIRESSF